MPKKTLPVIFFVQTLITDTVQFKVTCLNGPQSGNRFRKICPIKLGSVDILHLLASGTDKMVVLVKVNIKEVPFVGKMQFPDDPQLIKGGQGSVDRIQGYGRHPDLQAPMDILRRRMVLLRQQVLEYLQSLWGQLHPRLVAEFSDFIKLVILRGHIRHKSR